MVLRGLKTISNPNIYTPLTSNLKVKCEMELFIGKQRAKGKDITPQDQHKMANFACLFC